MKKIVLLGATGIGKTRLLCHHSSLIPAPSIIPVDYTFSIRGNPGSDTEVVLWDCPGGDKEIDRLRPSFVYSSSSSLDNPTHLVLLAFNSVESLLLLEDKVNMKEREIRGGGSLTII